MRCDRVVVVEWEHRFNGVKVRRVFGVLDCRAIGRATFAKVNEIDTLNVQTMGIQFTGVVILTRNHGCDLTSWAPLQQPSRSDWSRHNWAIISTTSRDNANWSDMLRLRFDFQLTICTPSINYYSSSSLDSLSTAFLAEFRRRTAEYRWPFRRESHPPTTNRTIVSVRRRWALRVPYNYSCLQNNTFA